MRPLLLIVLLILVQRPIEAKDTYASIKGTVTKSGSSEGIADVLVTISLEKKGGKQQKFQARTDPSGSYSFEKLAAGTYWISVEKTGFESISSGRHMLTLAKGQQVREFVFSLIEGKSGGTIHGRVIQPDGRLLSGVPVELVKATSRNGQRFFLASGSKVATDANGEFQFSVDAGEYYVRTATDETHQGVRSYSPGSEDPEKAIPLNVVRGGNVSANIQLSVTPTYRISVRIREMLPDRGSRYIAAFYLIDRNSSIREIGYLPTGCTCPPDGAYIEARSFTALGNDRYEIRGVRPGFYDLIASMWIGDRRPGEFYFAPVGEPLPSSMAYEGRTSVEVRDTDVDGGTIEIVRGVDVKGKFTSIGKIRSSDDAWVRLADERGTSPLIGERNNSSQFIIRNVPAGRHAVSFQFLPAEAYVDEVRQGGRIIADPVITIGSVPFEPMEVILKPGGVVSGRIENGEGALVVILPAVPPSQFDSGRRIARASGTGEFKVQGIPPGDYRVYAFNLYSVDESYFDPVFMSRHDSQGVRVTVMPGVPVSVQPKLINP